jgi:signal transduction histidine kinase
MRPGGIQAALGSLTLGLLAGAGSATAQPLGTYSSDRMLALPPLAIALGAIAFAAIASLIAYRARKRSNAIERAANVQVTRLRAALDQAEAAITGLPEVTMVWRNQSTEPEVFGPVSMLSGTGIGPRGTSGTGSAPMTWFYDWLEPSAADRLVAAVKKLRTSAVEFELTLPGRSGQEYRLAGRVRQGTHILRISPNSGPAEPGTTPRQLAAHAHPPTAISLVSTLDLPAFARNQSGQVTKENAAFSALMSGAKEGRVHLERALADLDAGKSAHFDLGGQSLGGQGRFTLHALNLEGAGLCLVLPQPEAIQGSATQTPSTRLASPEILYQAALDRLPTPIAMFDANAKLILFNHAYAQLWPLDPKWLSGNPTEHAILDQLRRQGRLPRETDHRKWRARHLRAYGLEKTRKTLWVLPGGLTLNVLATPANTPSGKGVIYVFDNSTTQLDLERQLNAIVDVQRETLESLSEAVAVFGTDARLKLYNPQISRIWGLPLNVLKQLPHIDQISAACARAMPEDGARIWADLKKSVIDFTPHRKDGSGRIERVDGRLIDFATVRLPDGQTLMTFLDVTNNARYERVLKERNEALVTADRLKDAFVRNVSYELRSPLTSIIGFADMLVGEQGTGLTAVQKNYVDYIRASSQSLMLIIDNILVLANVDAGIVDLHPEPVDIPQVINSARAGVAATLRSSGVVDPANIEIEIDPDLPQLIADRLRLTQILFNLLSNAVRYSDPGAPVRLTVTGRPERILFRVTDEGAGIPDEAIASVFDRFEGYAVNGRQRGTGLGLSIVSTFVHLHGGTVKIERRQPHGTSVTVNLPVRQRAYGT